MKRIAACVLALLILLSFGGCAKEVQNSDAGISLSIDNALTSDDFKDTSDGLDNADELADASSHGDNELVDTSEGGGTVTEPEDTVGPSERVLLAVEQGDYLDAQSIYNNEVLGHFDAETSVANGISAQIDDIIEEYNNGELSYDDALLQFNKIEKANVYNTEQLSRSQVYFEELAYSKNAYELAEDYMERADYIGAYCQYLNVIEGDNRYDSVQEKMLQAKTQYKADVLASVAAAEEENNYSVAYAALSEGLECFSTDVELEAALTKCVDLYVGYTISEAQAQFDTGKDYGGAMRIINQTMADIGENETLLSEFEKYQEYIPVYLTDLEYTQASEDNIVGLPRQEKFYTDVNGNTYDRNTVICHYKKGDQYVIYDLNFRYSSLSGTIYRPYDSLSCPDPWSNQTTVQIYGDDVLIYEAPDISSNTYDPIPFSIDISGVRNLKIVIGGSWYVGDFYGYNPLVCMAEVIIQK